MVVVQIELVVLFEYFLQTSWLFCAKFTKAKTYRTRLKKGDFRSRFLATPDAILKIA